MSKILGNHRPATELLFDGSEEFESRRFHPPSALGAFRARWNGPGAGEAEEVVNTNGVEQFEDSLETPHPPGEARLLVHAPLVLRMPPMLSVLIEPIRRIARHSPRLSAPVELEELRMTPDIRAVLCDKDGQVADQPEATTMCAVAQHAPLTVELELDEAMSGN